MGDTSSVQLDARLQELLDKDAIREVLARYVRGIDRFDLDLVRSVFYPDALEDHGPFKGLSHDWVAQFDPAQFHVVHRHHHLGQSLIELRGDVAYCETYVVLGTGREHGGAEPNLLLLHGRYVDKFERRDGEWKIARRTAVVDHATQITSDEWAGLADDVRGKKHPDDLVYQLPDMDDDRGRMTTHA